MVKPIHIDSRVRMPNAEKAIQKINATMGVKGFNEDVREILRNIVNGVYLENDLIDLISLHDPNKAKNISKYREFIEIAKRLSPSQSQSGIQQSNVVQDLTAAVGDMAGALKNLSENPSCQPSGGLGSFREQEEEEYESPLKCEQQPGGDRAADMELYRYMPFIAAFLGGILVLILILALYGTSFSMMKTVKDKNDQEVKEFDTVKLILMIIGFILGAVAGFLITRRRDKSIDLMGNGPMEI